MNFELAIASVSCELDTNKTQLRYNFGLKLAVFSQKGNFFLNFSENIFYLEHKRYLINFVF